MGIHIYTRCCVFITDSFFNIPCALAIVTGIAIISSWKGFILHFYFKMHFYFVVNIHIKCMSLNTLYQGLQMEDSGPNPDRHDLIQICIFLWLFGIFYLLHVWYDLKSIRVTHFTSWNASKIIEGNVSSCYSPPPPLFLFIYFLIIFPQGHLWLRPGGSWPEPKVDHPQFLWSNWRKTCHDSQQLSYARLVLLFYLANTLYGP